MYPLIYNGHRYLRQKNFHRQVDHHWFPETEILLNMIYKDNLHFYNVLVWIFVVLRLHNVYKKTASHMSQFTEICLVFDYILNIN